MNKLFKKKIVYGDILKDSSSVAITDTYGKIKTSVVPSTKSDWPERDDLPFMTVEEATKIIDEYLYPRAAVISPHIHTGVRIETTDEQVDFSLTRDVPGFKQKTTCCASQDKYKNIISNNMKFWACRSCGADLGDIEEGNE